MSWSSASMKVGTGANAHVASGITKAEQTLAHVASRLRGEIEVTVAAATGKPADVIVVGSRRMKGIGRVLGSIANDVAHHAPCSVYIAKTTG